jgi:hypothetical protein
MHPSSCVTPRSLISIGVAQAANPAQRTTQGESGMRLAASGGGQVAGSER